MDSRRTEPGDVLGAKAFRWAASLVLPGIVLAALGFSYTGYADLRVQREHYAQLRRDIAEIHADLERFKQPGERWAKTDGEETRRRLAALREFLHEYIKEHAEFGFEATGRWKAEMAAIRHRLERIEADLRENR